MGGVGVGNARIEVLNLVTGVKRTGTTNNFGYYIVDGLSSADLYMVTISHRRHQFFDPQRTVTLDSDISGVDFVTVW
ncbi:MAG TPA: carboxypeptidase-like regulatory domain-containing protein [Pyrinomonadaceae bacterium]|nr:carboxypeptidase-like regulatory domain-containing protein [Pyrinomonadaceae bacterium]HMP66170.1 carboxypeptidase-like regulatory domain-containing protein [Pyrinomonadaceae bacterium]